MHKVVINNSLLLMTGMAEYLEVFRTTVNSTDITRDILQTMPTTNRNNMIHINFISAKKFSTLSAFKLNVRDFVKTPIFLIAFNYKALRMKEFFNLEASSEGQPNSRFNRIIKGRNIFFIFHNYLTEYNINELM